MRYDLEFHEAALREWNDLDHGVRVVLKKRLLRRHEDPHVPAARLVGDLANFYKIKHNATGHRLVYEVIDHRLVVFVIDIGPRADLSAYRSAARRRAAPLD